jgi:hypothetical protein
MALLPKTLPWPIASDRWAAQLNPLLNSPQNNSLILEKVPLINGTTIINHLLGKVLTGWKVIRQRSAASIYDNQDSNQSPQLTLVLISDASVVVDLEVF